MSGLAAGMVHVVTGPDHLAAITPIALEDPRRAAGIGARWGLGHGLGALALGGVGILARQMIDIQAVSAWAEIAAGFTLIVIGLWALRRALRIVVHAHPHEHAGEEHHHYHVHSSAKAHGRGAAHGLHTHAAFFVGVLHGAAGTGHLFGVLPSLALEPAQAIVYLIAYFLAAVMAMTGVGALMGRWARDRGLLSLRRTMLGASALAVLVGVFWVGHSWLGA
ncbi:hydantoin utilization protein A [Pseudenhygromyxa sp. WMMC2535]|uniref:hydantoin utilization protein A n=1 Tax=Pseudenhygromyxa sp. WMMC2535 TaxID=2712867 RepID=UPI001595AC81|nr:hydantoin utilization protein A [Pseudenhygromyxa sp. WMMC2535]NVB42750.1 hydantoin utilization protein A [Pseudenhygromyxa sp. WMMC2535]